MKCLQYKHCGIVLLHENQKMELANLFSLDKLNEAEINGTNEQNNKLKFRLPYYRDGR